MKRLILTIALVALIATPALALPSLDFSTEDTSPSSWTLSSGDGTNWTLSFGAGTIEVDSPLGDPVIDDLVDLPSTTLGSITDHTTYLTATLTPSGSLTITDDTGGFGTVMTASVGTGGTLVVGTTYVAYSTPQDDLNVTSHTASYSTTIDGFAMYDAAGGYEFDLSFSGDATGSKNLYAMIKAGSPDSATGTISGQMSIIPEPATLSLLGLGSLVLLRKRRA